MPHVIIILLILNSSPHFLTYQDKKRLSRDTYINQIIDPLKASPPIHMRRHSVTPCIKPILCTWLSRSQQSSSYSPNKQTTQTNGTRLLTKQTSPVVSRLFPIPDTALFSPYTGETTPTEDHPLAALF